MRSKYGNKKVKVDDHKFDSIAEAKYYKQLLWLQEHKEINFFRIQPPYLLQEAFEKDGIKHRRIDYSADFEIHHNDGSIEVVDVKTTATITETFKVKRKLFDRKFPHKFTVLIWVQELSQFIEFEEFKKLKAKGRKARAKKG
ncbi:DUF1064 domain-containing protein [Jeotgalibacillus proteolyticus]|uniref:DUF1064 domain-containing protein n=1 Tax=Jeotgalibacillus proteolyticus TaxID=2082395 RepID=A0A2S5GAM0_9BACL|nr:DUF1064 domain-containing protein [Jeotgalibacillus proteolyticus]PPA70059.1 hypothetical protein C4B60_10730 [Jeotgalibacillus proteolyticus]